MNRYSMNNVQDITRLENQNKQGPYNIKDEIAYFEFLPNEKILDAGVGSGLVTRTIHSINKDKNLNYSACDISESAIKEAEIFFKKEGIIVNTFVSNLENIQSESNIYDKVISRYVLEHMSTPLDGLNEFHRILKPGGRAHIIDLDGMLFNLYTDNEALKLYLKKLLLGFKFDLFIGRKIPSLMKEAGFKDIVWNISVMPFNNKYEINLEIENYDSRLTMAKEIIVDILGSELKYFDFKKLYLNELSKQENVLFYNKFYVSGTK